MILIIMGVSGSGKTTVGKILADRSGYKFYDADDFHSKESIEKMQKGIGLTDNDREQWLRDIRDRVINKEDNVVIACSALKKSYRDFLSLPNKGIVYIYLKGDRQILEKRLSERKGHYAGADLLDSQLATLEEPGNVLTIDIRNKPEVIVDRIINNLEL